MEESVSALVAAVDKQPTEGAKRECLLVALMDLSTSFAGTLFADSVEDMQKYWDDQATDGGDTPPRDLEYCAKILVSMLESNTIDINNIGDIINEDLIPAVLGADNSRREVLAELLKTLAVYNTGDFGLAAFSATKHLGRCEADLEIGPE